MLDRLLEHGRIGIEGIGGASAGAMNAVVCAHGFTIGGREGARQALQDSSEAIACKAPFHSMSEGTSPLVGEGLQASTAPALKAFLLLTSPWRHTPVIFSSHTELALAHFHLNTDEGERKTCVPSC